MFSGLEHDRFQAALIFCRRIFVHVNISYRFLSLWVISGMFGFYCFERKYMVLQFCSCHLCVDTIRPYSLLLRYCIFFSGLLFAWFYKKPVVEVLVSGDFCLHFDNTVTYQVLEFPLPQLTFVLTFTHSVKDCISKAMGTGHLSPFTLLWESAST